MTRIRVYELAKEVGVSSKELIERIEDLKLDISSHMSTMEEDDAKLIKELIKDEDKNNGEVDKEAKKAKLVNEATNDEEFEEEEVEVIQIEDNIIVRDLAEELDISARDRKSVV